MENFSLALLERVCYCKKGDSKQNFRPMADYKWIFLVGSWPIFREICRKKNITFSSTINARMVEFLCIRYFEFLLLSFPYSLLFDVNTESELHKFEVKSPWRENGNWNRRFSNSCQNIPLGSDTFLFLNLWAQIWIPGNWN